MKQLRKPITKAVSILLVMTMIVSLFTIIPFEVGAAIGAGYEAIAFNIDLSGGVIVATAFGGGAGIGGEDGSGGTIEIYSSDIYAEGVNNASGIGNGEDGDSTGISIFGDSTVKAWGGDDGGNAIAKADNGAFHGYHVSAYINPALRAYAEPSSDETTKFIYTATAEFGGYQIARIRGIAAKQLQNSFDLTVTAGITSGTVTYSPMNYCDNALNGGTDDTKLLNVVKAISLERKSINATDYRYLPY